jgi:hypothetical protein
MSNPHDDPNQPPTDSVLRRHYEQLRAAQAATPAPAPAPAPSAPRAAPAAAPAPAAKPQATGVRGWLGRLFGG